MIARFKAWAAGIGASIIAAGAVLLYLFGRKSGKKKATIDRLKDNIDIINKNRAAGKVALSAAESSADHARQMAADSADLRQAAKEERERDAKENTTLDDAADRADDADRRRRESLSKYWT